MTTDRSPGPRRHFLEPARRRPNPWQEVRKRRWRRNLLFGSLLVAAIALGVFIGLMLPGLQSPDGDGQPTPIYNPDPPRQRRAETPAPQPADDGRAARTQPGGRTVAFGFCAGRSGDNCVIDGDTFIMDGAIIRLAGIDTPEIGGAQCREERARGEAAEQRLHQILNSGPVQIVPAGGRDRDRYDRLLRDALVAGQSVSEWLVAEGHARRWRGRKESWC
ncbi:thermonuclease family protein [Sandaracinobacter sp.]|uniref:thermonuclease family protein n=1 Tax=Sandaracinobacter sp. TaxID=2487581 RepID=UPI0035AE9F38